MGHVYRLKTGDAGEDVVAMDGAPASVTPIEGSRCALCGASLVSEPIKYRMVSPFVAMGSVTVCRRCHKAALSEGYRPAD